MVVGGKLPATILCRCFDRFLCTDDNDADRCSALVSLCRSLIRDFTILSNFVEALVFMRGNGSVFEIIKENGVLTRLG